MIAIHEHRKRPAGSRDLLQPIAQSIKSDSRLVRVVAVEIISEAVTVKNKAGAIRAATVA
jgi:hypothetical protein